MIKTLKNLEKVNNLKLMGIYKVPAAYIILMIEECIFPLMIIIKTKGVHCLHFYLSLYGRS